MTEIAPEPTGATERNESPEGGPVGVKPRSRGAEISGDATIPLVRIMAGLAEATKAVMPPDDAFLVGLAVGAMAESMAPGVGPKISAIVVQSAYAMGKDEQAAKDVILTFATAFKQAVDHD